MKKVEKVAVSNETLRGFLTVLRSMIELFGVNRISAAAHYFQLMCEAIERQIYESENHVSPEHREDIDRRRFIAVFRARYLEFFDLEYYSAVTPLDGKMIGTTVTMLADKGFSVDEYLKWMFEQFLPDNPKFKDTFTIKFTCSGFAIQGFLVANKDLFKVRQEEMVRRRESIDLINRARALIRSASSKEEEEKVKNDIIEFRDKRIMIDELRRRIEVCENAHKKCPVLGPDTQAKPEA
jgi:hypothetical protein